MGLEIVPAAWPGDDWGQRLVTHANAVHDLAPVRRAALTHLRAHGCTNVANAVLVLSELVTNAVIHAGGADHVAVMCDASSIGICVRDRSRIHPTPRRTPTTVGGHGLHIVDELTRCWGTSATSDGKQTWALLDADVSDDPPNT